MNWKLSRNKRYFPNMKAMYFSILLGMQFISKSCSFPMVPISCIMKWESYPCRLWNITGILNCFGLILNLRLRSWCADPLYCPLIWHWSQTRMSLLPHFCPQIWNIKWRSAVMLLRADSWVAAVLRVPRLARCYGMFSRMTYPTA